MRNLLCPVLLALLAGLVGCAGTSTPTSPSVVQTEAVPPEVSNTTDGLRFKWVMEGSGYLFVKPPNVDLSRYTAYLLEPPKLHFTPLSGRPNRTDAVRLSRSMARVIRPKLERTFGWKAVEEPGPEVIRIRALVSDIEFSSPDASAHTRTTAIVSSSGMVVFTLDFRDSTTKEPLARYAVRRPLPGGTFSGPYWHELDRARMVFRAFGGDLETSLGALAAN